jgi:hypothetical protein
MKYPVIFAASLILTPVLPASTAFAQLTYDREQAIIQCMAKAKAATPDMTDDLNDPDVRIRSEIYSSCMKSLGQEP